MAPAGGRECLTVAALAPAEAGEHLLAEVLRPASAGGEALADRECGDWAEVEGPALGPAEARECLTVPDPDLARALAADSAMADVDGTGIEATVSGPVQAGPRIPARGPDPT